MHRLRGKHTSKGAREFWEHLALCHAFYFSKSASISAEGMFATSFEANHRAISTLPVSHTFAQGHLNGKCTTRTHVCGFSASSLFRWAGRTPLWIFFSSPYGFTLAVSWSRKSSKNSLITMECTSSCCKSSRHFMASCDTHTKSA